mgnify:CR=1 FL=1
MKLFFDTEFTGLTRDTFLISLAFYGNDGCWFYAEFNDYDESKLSEWHIENVIKKLEFGNIEKYFAEEERKITLKDCKDEIVKHLTAWLKLFDAIEIWADVPHYDWVLLCDLFGGALNLPKNIHYICRDIATLLFAKNIDVDIIRTGFVKDELMNVDLKQHNALFDAMVGKLCYEKLIKM